MLLHLLVYFMFILGESDHLVTSTLNRKLSLNLDGTFTNLQAVNGNLHVHLMRPIKYKYVRLLYVHRSHKQITSKLSLSDKNVNYNFKVQ